jgi:transposase
MPQDEKADNFNDFSDIAQNQAAQSFLLEIADKMTTDELRREILKRHSEYSQERMRLRDRRRGAAERKGKSYDSFLDTKLKEVAFYEKIGNQLADNAVSWLQKELNRMRGEVIEE